MSESREIKFRLWDKACKSMVYPDNNNWFRMYLNGCVSEDSVWCTQDCVLIQYTGLKDINGKEIYARDIVKCYRVIREPIYGDIVSEVEIVRGDDNVGIYENEYGDRIERINYEVKFGDFDIEIVDSNNNQNFIVTCCGWYLEQRDYICSLSESAATMIEVIGNIYENPELLNANYSN